MTKPNAAFKRQLAKALASKNLELALNRTLPKRREARVSAFQEASFEPLRDDLQARKRDAIDQLPSLITQFKETAEKAGAVVHQAYSSQDALDIVGELTKANSVKKVVKSKSMATEEIDLNEYLHDNNIEVIETDLGEWIVQLAGEKPSHLITPAMHKTREEIAELFTKVTGEYVPPEIPKLVEVARKSLRQHFIDADMGITGANAAIAETGSILIISNEGNGRLVSTLPPIHIAILGIEKIVPTLDDANAILRVLSRSGTGQTVTTYMSYITGPSRTADIELSLTTGVHGPKELHIILLDNGRNTMRDLPEFRDALACIRCGACLNECPSFQEVGGHSFGYKYTGPIGLILTKFHHGEDNAAGPISLCLGCNACATVCPTGIDIPRMILDSRIANLNKKPMGLLKGQILGFLSYQRGFAKIKDLARLFQMPFRSGPNLLNMMSLKKWRNLPQLPKQTFLESRGLGATINPSGIIDCAAKGKTVLYYPACLTDNLSPSTGDAAVKVLSSLGAQVTLPPAQVCCGLAHMNAGDKDTAIKFAKQTITMLEKSETNCILGTSTSCVAMMQRDYPHLLRDEPEWKVRATNLAKRVTDFTQFIYSIAKIPDGILADKSVGNPPNKITYHDSCQSSHRLGLGPEPRHILEKVLGAEINEMEESDTCCGFGGTFSLDYPRISERILGHKLQHIEDTSADILITDNPGCAIHINGGLQGTGRKVEVMHLAEFMASRINEIHSTNMGEEERTGEH